MVSLIPLWRSYQETQRASTVGNLSWKDMNEKINAAYFQVDATASWTMEDLDGTGELEGSIERWEWRGWFCHLIVDN